MTFYTAVTPINHITDLTDMTQYCIEHRLRYTIKAKSDMFRHLCPRCDGTFVVGVEFTEGGRIVEMEL